MRQDKAETVAVTHQGRGGKHNFYSQEDATEVLLRGKIQLFTLTKKHQRTFAYQKFSCMFALSLLTYPDGCISVLAQPIYSVTSIQFCQYGLKIF